jgi:CubicO group peptidase (beta-lactamase class C family)
VPGADTDAGGAPQPPPICHHPNGAVPDRYEALVQVFESELSANPPGAALAILEGGHLRFTYAIGTKGPSSKEPVCPSSLFRIGSVTKAITAAAYLHVVGEGRAGIDQRLVDVAPDVALPKGADLDALTMRDLLSQQSGIFDVTTAMTSFAGPSDDAYLSTYLTGPSFGQAVYFMNPPRALWNYSNVNYLLAGLAVERTSGLAYPEAVRRHVTKPLGMDRTVFRPEHVLADGDYTNGASTNPDGTPADFPPNAYDNAAIRPAGSLFSSVLDLAKFVEFVLRGDDDVMPRALWRAMKSPQAQTDSDGNVDAYGYGVFVERGIDYGPNQYYPGRRIDHAGAIPGWSAYWSLHPDLGFAFIVLQNADANPGFNATFQYALQNLAGIQPTAEPPSTLPRPTSEFPAYAGSYNDPNNIGPVAVTYANGTLNVAMPGLDAAGIPYDPVLVPTKRDNFALTIDGFTASLTFIRGKDGRFDWLRAIQLFVAERVPAGDGGTP